MPKISDDDVLRYLEDHTYDEAMEQFGISRMTVARIKKRNKVSIMPSKIKLGIIGTGNAASALVQGIEFYKSRSKNIGLLHPTLAGYHISDIEVVSAFDISENKVGKALGKALEPKIIEDEFKRKKKVAGYNDLDVLVNLDGFKIPVLMGEIKDGAIEETKDQIKPSKAAPVDVAKALKDAGTEIVLCLLPSGADNAVKFYAEQSLKAGCAFINATPTSIATDKEFAQKYADAGLPLIGDDLQDQFGATILHKLILKEMVDQGIEIKESYALDVGGGAESLNTIHRTRHIKREIKSKSVQAALNIDAPIVAGTSDYVPHLGNGRNTMVWIVGKGFLGSEIIMDIKISTKDGPNGGSVLSDIIRATQIALHQGTAGPINEISAYGFKNPPKKIHSPAEAAAALAHFVLGTK